MRDGSGTHSLPEADFVENTVIDQDAMNNVLQDISDELTNSVAADGQTTMTGALKMGSQKVTLVAAATLRTDAPNTGQVQDAAFTWCGTSGGSANAHTATPAPAITSYATGHKFHFLSGFTNTGAATLQVSGIASPKNILDIYGNAMVGGELTAGAYIEVCYTGSAYVLISVRYLGPVFTWKKALSGASVDFDPLPTGFAKFTLDIYDYIGATDGAVPRVQVKTGGAFVTSSYSYVFSYEDGSTETITNTTSAIQLANDVGNAATESFNGTVELWNPDGTALYKRVVHESTYTNAAGATLHSTGGGHYAGATTAVTALRIIPSSGNITSGTAVLTGFRY